MASFYESEKIPGEKNRLLVALGFSLIFHVLVLIFAGLYSFQFETNKIGPMDVSFELPVELPPPPVLPPVAAQAPAESTRPAPPAREAPEPAPSRPAASPSSPAPPAIDETPRLSGAYAGLFDPPEETSPAPGRSGPELTAPRQSQTAPAPRREAGVQGSGSLAESAGPARADTGRKAPAGPGLDLSALDRALDASAAGQSGESGVLVVREAGNTYSSALPENTAGSQGQIRFTRGTGRELIHSEKIDISSINAPPGYPDFLVTVTFTVMANGTLTGITVNSPAVIPGLNVAILSSMRNWRFAPSSGSGSAEAQIELYIRIK